MDNSEVDETTGSFTEPSPGRESQGVQVQDPNTVWHVNYRPDASEKSRHRTASRNALNDLVIGTKGNRKFKKNITVVAEGTVMAHQTIDGQLAGSNEDNNNSSWFGTDEKHIFLKSTPCTFNVPAFQHGPIRLVKSDLINAINAAEPKPVDSPSDSLDWVALQWATTEGVQDLFSDPTDLSENAREQLGDRLCDWLGDLGYSSNSLGALVSEGDVVRNYKQHADERPPSPVLHDWTDVYRTLSRRQKQGLSHDTFQVQESDGLSEVMSLVSYAESIFDAAATMSTASSIPGDAQELISKFVNLLVRDTSVARMLSMALSDTGMGQERFRRNFSRILRSYSRELRRSLETGKPEDNHPSYGLAAAFVSRKAPHASHLIVSRFSQARTSVPSRNALPESDGDSTSESEESEGENEIPNMEKLESFFVTGEPFRLLRWKLRALIIPDSFLTRVRISTEQLGRIASRCGLMTLLSRAQEQKGRSFENFWPDFADQIECLARNLRVQCSTLGQIRVADFLMTYSQYIAARLEESLATEKGSDIRKNSTSDGILQDVVANTLPEVWEIDFPGHWGFIASAKAFQDFFDDVRDLAYPTLFSRAGKLISKWNEPEGQRLLPVLSELRWAVERMQDGRARKSLFNISPQDSSFTDRLKLAVEASTGAEWDWWPFRSPLRHQPYTLPGSELLSWTCVSFSNSLTLLLYYDIIFFFQRCLRFRTPLMLPLRFRYLSESPLFFFKSVHFYTTVQPDNFLFHRNDHLIRRTPRNKILKATGDSHVGHFAVRGYRHVTLKCCVTWQRRCRFPYRRTLTYHQFPRAPSAITVPKGLQLQ